MHGLSWPQLRNLFLFAHRRLQEVRLPQVAGSLTFTTVLALVPMLTIALAVLTAFPLFANFQHSLEIYFAQNLMPKTISATVMSNLSQFATKATRLSAVGGIALLVTALATMAMIDKTFNEIWKVRNPRPWVQRFVVYWAIISLGPLLIGISISASSFVFSATGDVVKAMPLLGLIFYTLLSIAFTMGAYTLLYSLVPNRPIAWRDAMWGGLFAALAFEIAKRLFAYFIKQFPTYTVIYGALAALPLFLLWIYLTWLITLFGAVVVAALPVVKYERWWHVPVAGSIYEDAMAVMRCMVLANRSDGLATVDVRSIRHQTRFGEDEIRGILEKMADLGWVAKLTPEPIKKRSRFWWRKDLVGAEKWVLIMNPAALSLADVYRVFVFDTDRDSHLANKVHQVLAEGMSESLLDYFMLD